MYDEKEPEETDQDSENKMTSFQKKILWIASFLILTVFMFLMAFRVIPFTAAICGMCIIFLIYFIYCKATGQSLKPNKNKEKEEAEAADTQTSSDDKAGAEKEQEK